MIEDTGVAKGTKEDMTERVVEVGIAEPMGPLERVELFIRALENDAVEYGGEYDPIWWAGNPKPDPFAPINGSFVYDCHGEKLCVGDDFAVWSDYWPCDWEHSPVRYRAFGICDASGSDEPTEPEVVTFGRVDHDDIFGGSAMGFEASEVWTHEFCLDDEKRYQIGAETLEMLEAIESDKESRGDPNFAYRLLHGFYNKIRVPFIPNEEWGEIFDYKLCFQDETRPEIRGTIELIERWLKVRRRALDEKRPVPLAYWRCESLSEDYNFCGPKELSDREREAVSLYAERPYLPQWRGYYYCPPDDILLEIERRLGPAESKYWRPKTLPEDSADATCDGPELDGGLAQGSSPVSRGIDGVKAAVGKKLIAVGKKLLGE